jgi:zinc protease
MLKEALPSLALVACLWSPLPALAANPPVAQEFVLDNGLRLVVQEDHRAPVVVSQIWYHVGSSYEHDGLTGLSHALEHMMFKGTRRLKPGEFTRIVAESGGEDNAFTSNDFTAYYQHWHVSRLPLSFELESDRMRNLLLDEALFAKEREVIMEERRLRTEDNPRAMAQETVESVAFLVSPYRHPTIGWMADIAQMTVTDLRTWYERWYAPNNATLVVVGDVRPEEVHALARRYFGRLPQKEIRPVRPRPEPTQTGIKRVTTRFKARLPYLMMSYKVPVLRSAIERPQEVQEWEPYALAVLTELLDGDPSSRFTQRLVRGRQLATSLDAGYDPISRLDTLLYAAGTPTTGHTVAELEEAVRAEIRDLQEKPVPAEELGRVKTRVVTDAIYERDSASFQGMLIGTLSANGLDWRLKDTYVDKIKAVTAEQIQTVARKYLVDEGLTVGVLQPEDEKQDDGKKGEKGEKAKDTAPATPTTAAPTTATPTTAAPTAATPTTAAPTTSAGTSVTPAAPATAAPATAPATPASTPVAPTVPSAAAPVVPATPPATPEVAAPATPASTSAPSPASAATLPAAPATAAPATAPATPTTAAAPATPSTPPPRPGN